MAKRRRRRDAGQGSVYWSTSQQRYVGELSLGYDDGSRIRKVLVGPRGRKDDDARLGVADRLERLRTQTPAIPSAKRGSHFTPRTKLGEYLEAWVANHDLSDAARETYEWAITLYLVPQLGSTRLMDLDRRELRRFFDALSLGAASKEKIRTVLRAALRDAVLEERILAVNPADRLKLRARNAASDHREIAVWDASEATRFLRTARRTEYFSLFVLMIVGALGPAEAFGIRWKDVDLKNARVAIAANLTEVGGRLILKDTKTKSRRRNVALPTMLTRELVAIHKRRKPRPTDYVFTAPEGGGVRRSTFRTRVWLPLLKKAKVPPITLYGLRHSSASIMAAMGVPLVIASRALGHANIRTTADTYTHLFEESQRDVAAKFDRLLKNI